MDLGGDSGVGSERYFFHLAEQGMQVWSPVAPLPFPRNDPPGKPWSEPSEVTGLKVYSWTLQPKPINAPLVKRQRVGFSGP